jgi:hypothetical protein
VGLFAAQTKAQGVQQTVEIAKVDVQKVAGGYRASKVIGSNVLNDANETIGKIDDLLVTRDGKEPYAVLSIGASGHGHPLGRRPLRQPWLRR